MSKKAAISAVLSIVLCGVPAAATELTPDAPSGDPNGPPPMPPPMPVEGQPGSVAPPPAAGSTDAQLATSDQQDNGIGLKLFYLQPEIGFGWASIGGAIPLPPASITDYSQFRSGAGPVLGLGVGAEFITFQFGARLRAISTPHWNLWNAGGEVLFQPGSGRFWPHVGLTVGYAWASRFDDAMCGNVCDQLSVSGLSLGLRGGVQYFVAKNVEIGADATLDYLSLKRPAISGNSIYAEDGKGNGAMLGLMGHIGIHLP